VNLSVDSKDPSVPDAPVSERYYLGTILLVHPGSRTGWRRTSEGREAPFAARDLLLRGTAHGCAALREGLRAGFDLGRTSQGLCMTTIRVYETP
jgi:hypothetical protein